MTPEQRFRLPFKARLRAGFVVAVAAALLLWAALPAIQTTTVEAAGPPSHATAKADKAKAQQDNGKAVGPSHARGLERAAEARGWEGHPGRGPKQGNGHQTEPAQLIIQAASNYAEVIQVSGDGGTNIVDIIQENFQLALNIQLESLNDLPEQLDVYLANLLAGSLDLGPYGQVLGVQVSQDASNAAVIAQFTGDDGTNIVVIYQVNIQISINVSA